jgi:hypothetical protein
LSLSPISSSPYSAAEQATGAGGASATSNDAQSATDAASQPFAALLAGVLAPPPLVQDAAVPSIEAVVEEASAVNGTESGGGKGEATTEAASAIDMSLAALGAAAAGLDPALRAKLAAVVARMRDEFGREVRVVEGRRSQLRQDQLFAQGRSADGPIVTWTRSSQHTQGRAADLVIDGGYDDAAGFALLQKVAEQEGLHTLGARDPGHVELRGAGAGPSALDGMVAAARDARLAAAADTASVNAAPIARPALVAAVAPLARIATVASVASVASVAVASSARPSSNGSQAGTSEGDKRRGESSEQSAGTGIHAGAHAYGSLSATPSASGSGDGGMQSVGPTTAARVDRLMETQDAPGPRSISRLTLSLDNGNGGHDQVRIGMRGNSVGASFDMGDSASADRISSRLGELTRALEQRGLEPDAFQVRSTSVPRESDATRVTGIGSSSLREVADASATRNEGRSDTSGDSRQRFDQHGEQQDRARRQQDEQRRRNTVFSLLGEDR